MVHRPASPIIDFNLEQFANSGPNVTKRRPTQSIGPNQLAWDLGVDNIYDDGTIQERIKHMDEKFHLVMILEKFEVRGTLGECWHCWSVDSLLFYED